VLLPENHSALKQVIRFSRLFAQHFLRFLTKHYSPAFHQDYQAIVDIYVQIMEQHVEANEYDPFYFLLSVLDLHPEYDTRPLQALFGRVIRLQIGQTLHRLDISLNTALLGELNFQEGRDEVEPNDLQQHFLSNPNRLAQQTYHSTWHSLLSQLDSSLEFPLCYLFRHKLYDQKMFFRQYFRFVQVSRLHPLEYPVAKAARFLAAQQVD